MSINIIVKATGLNIVANLKDEALASLIQLVQANRDDSVSQTASFQREGVGAALLASFPTPLAGTFTGDNNENAVKEFLKVHGAAELLNRLQWESYPEKILLLGAWHEARGGSTPWRSADMDEIFKQAKEKPPANFPRDIKNTIKSAWVHNETPRTYTVTRTGWNKIGQALESLPQ